MRRRLGALPIAVLLACDGGERTAGPPGSAADAGTAAPEAGGTPQVPPRGQRALEAWLAEGHYKQWRCEDRIFPARGNGAHGRHRICWNDLMVDSVSGTYPEGASSVKELYDGADRPNGYAVSLKVKGGAGDETWYWYERTGTSPTSRPVADGIAHRTCGPGCHAAAPRDNVYIRP